MSPFPSSLRTAPRVFSTGVRRYATRLNSTTTGRYLVQNHRLLSLTSVNATNRSLSTSQLASMEHSGSRKLRACFFRGGTSKGVFLLRDDLPENRSEWEPIILRLMGSPDPVYGRQLDGMGGGISSLSKVVVVGPAEDTQIADVSYTFIQVGVRDEVLDFSGNCGNLTSVVGPFAVLFGLVGCTRAHLRTGPSGDTITTVRALNTNTNKLINCTFPVGPSEEPSRGSIWPRRRNLASDNAALEPLFNLPQTEIAGVPGFASSLTLDFLDPGGARTGLLLPSENPVDVIAVRGLSANAPQTGHAADLPASLVDATNPTVIVSADAVHTAVCGHTAVRDGSDAQAVVNAEDLDYQDPYTLTILEDVRQSGARRMGLDPTAQAQPKVVVISPGGDDADLSVRALSMGALHKAVPMTVGLCLGVAAQIPGTIAHEAVLSARSSRRQSPQAIGAIRLGHPSGHVDVGADMDFTSGTKARSAKVVRTGRLLMEGHVYY